MPNFSSYHALYLHMIKYLNTVKWSSAPLVGVLNVFRLFSDVHFVHAYVHFCTHFYPENRYFRKKPKSWKRLISMNMGTRLVRDPDGLVGRTGLGSRTWPSFFPRIAYLAKCPYLVHVHYVFVNKKILFALYTWHF